MPSLLFLKSRDKWMVVETHNVPADSLEGRWHIKVAIKYKDSFRLLKIIFFTNP